MKVEFTLVEALDALRSKYNLPIDAKIELSGFPDNSNEKALCGRIVLMMNKYPDYLKTQKIAAIKELRDIIPNCGLRLAKDFIENYQASRSYMLTHEKLPIKDGNLFF